MKNLIFIILFLCSIFSLGQDKPFIIKVKSIADKLLIPATGDYLLTVKDSDGNVVNELNQVSSSLLNINTSSSGIGAYLLYYNHITTNVTSGKIYTLEFLNEGTAGLRIHTASLVNYKRFYNSEEVKEIIQWGNVIWDNDMSHFMHEASNVVLTATDSPDFSNINNMSYMFSYAEKFNGDIGGWDTSNVTNMSYMFEEAKIFNQDIGNWNTSKVKDMSYMFKGGALDPYIFNQDISTKSSGAWNTSNVTNMNGMFYYTKNFNQNIGNWDTSSVTDMGTMFFGAEEFDSYIGDWNTSKVNNMSAMFTLSLKFDKDISAKTVVNRSTYTAWDTSNVINMSRMFDYAKNFNQNIGNWDTSKVTDMNHMFSNTLYFNQDISTKVVMVNRSTYTAWDTSNVVDMSSMFNLASSFNQPIGNWNTSKVNNMSGMFQYAYVFNKELSTKSVTIGGITYNAWNTTIVTDMHNMFNYSSKFNQELSNWNVSSVKDFSHMFQDAIVFNSNLNNWNTSSAIDLSYMFNNANQFTSNLGGWNMNNIINYIPTTGLSYKGLYRMLNNSGLTCTDFSNTLISWANNQILRSENFFLTLNIDTDPINLSYNSIAQVALNSLINDYNWTIRGATYDDACGCTNPPTIIPNLNNINSPKFVISTIKNNEQAEIMKEHYNDSSNSFISLKKGLVLPRSNNHENLVKPVEGLIYYDTTDSCIKMYKKITETTGEWNCLRKKCFLGSFETEEQF